MSTRTLINSTRHLLAAVASLALVVMLLAGCDDGAATISSETSVTPFVAESRIAFQYGTPEALQSSNFTGEEAEAVRLKNRRLMIAHLRAFKTIRAELASDELSIAQKQRLAEELLAKHEGEPMMYLLEQTIGIRLMAQVMGDGTVASILDKADQTFSLSRSEQAAVGFATRLLVRNDNPNADVIARALHALDGYWTAEQIETTAHQAADAATSWLDDECAACDKGNLAVQTATARRASRMAQGVAVLHQIAQ